MGREQACELNELPHIYELEDMMDFVKRCKNLYIYGHGINQEYLLKYFDMCGVKIAGYVVTKLKENQEICFKYREMPIVEFEDIYRQNSVGIILALSDKYYHEIIPMFREKNFEDYFMMSEFNKRSIANQMRPRTHWEMGFEINLVDHCNLSCQMCDHFSQLSDPWFVDMNQFKCDMERMGELFEHEIGAVTLLGGEPTLHDSLIDCIKITREQFPNAMIIILTNGVKLLELETSPKGNLWEVCRECNVHITITVYPIKLDYQKIEDKAKEYGISLVMSSNIHGEELTRKPKISDKHTMNLKGEIEKFYCVNCLYFNKFNVLKNGRLYMCPIAAHIDIFNKCFKQNLELDELDSLDIYKIQSWKEISEFSANYVPFCKYCDLKHWGHHSQWKVSSKNIKEYI